VESLGLGRVSSERVPVVAAITRRTSGSADRVLGSNIARIRRPDQRKMVDIRSTVASRLGALGDFLSAVTDGWNRPPFFLGSYLLMRPGICGSVACLAPTASPVGGEGFLRNLSVGAY